MQEIKQFTKSTERKTVTENDEILETERGNSSPTPNSNKKEKRKQNLQVRKRKSY